MKLSHYQHWTIRLAWVLVLIVPGCALRKPHSTLNAIYSPLAKLPDYKRNPVIVIPGVLGSRLVDDETGHTVWGKYDRIHFRRQQADDLASVAIPMQQGVPLSELKDSVRSDGTLAYLELKIFGVPVELQAYQQILQTLGVGGYRDPDHPSPEGVVYGDDHFTCFQFDYDWRRDVAENAALLDQFIAEKREYIRDEYASRYGITDADIKFDIVAHSLGGLLTRYYLRYGSKPLPDDGSLPTLDWAGADSVQRLVFVGTPNAGSAFALRDLVNGHQLSRFLPYYPPAALGTMPSLYQMLPRPRHQTLVDANHPEIAFDFYDPKLWQQLKWGLAAPDQDDVLQELLPQAASREERQCIALDHQSKCLLKAKQLHQALDVPADPPPGVTLHLYAGDAIETPSQMSVDTRTGKIKVAGSSPGDDTTTRHSAVMSEQPVQLASTQPNSPIHWTSVMFLHTSHRKLTADPVFTDNVLALLLQGRRH
ncbi:esterase/lipase family protein [Novipirellula sp. SH528]|uniref:esterase/lipase family protein n=1 Tax=Novipirellula sp. SH528 TaxID=3454466 RepID=UPI003FA16029